MTCSKRCLQTLKDRESLTTIGYKGIGRIRRNAVVDLGDFFLVSGQFAGQLSQALV